MSRDAGRDLAASDPILVTGGSGFLGSAIIRAFSGKRFVYALSRRPSMSGAKPLAVDLAEGGEVGRLLEATPFTCCIHAAALADPDLCEKDPQNAWRVNVEGTHNLLKVCKKGKKRFVFLSTDYVFDGRKRNLYTEEDPVCPLQVYGETKAAAEKSVLELPRSLVIRLPFLIGYATPPERPDFATDALRRLWREEPAAYDDRQLRTPLVREDAAEAIRILADSSISGIIHLVPSETATKFDLALAFARHLGKPAELVQRNREGKSGVYARRPQSMRLSNEKFLAAVSGRFRFRPLRDSIAQVAEAFRKHEEFL
ncbi:MAG: NAD(P)-dependent oxidoreductase [Candidatus Methylacidiphilaceae bacterium]